MSKTDDARSKVFQNGLSSVKGTCQFAWYRREEQSVYTFDAPGYFAISTGPRTYSWQTKQQKSVMCCNSGCFITKECSFAVNWSSGLRRLGMLLFFTRKVLLLSQQGSTPRVWNKTNFFFTYQLCGLIPARYLFIPALLPMPHILGSWTACLILFHSIQNLATKDSMTKISDISLMRIVFPTMLFVSL